MPFGRVVLDLASKPKWVLDISPRGNVPLLSVARRDGSEAVLFESNVICEYLEETQPGARLHPEDPIARAEHRKWMDFGSAILGDLWGYEATQDATVFEQKRLALRANFERVEAAWARAPTSPAGNSVSSMQCSRQCFAISRCSTMSSTRIYSMPCPRVTSWRHALAARPSVRNAVAPEYPQHLMEFLRHRQAHLLTLAT